MNYEWKGFGEVESQTDRQNKYKTITDYYSKESEFIRVDFWEANTVRLSERQMGGVKEDGKITSTKRVLSLSHPPWRSLCSIQMAARLCRCTEQREAT